MRVQSVWIGLVAVLTVAGSAYAGNARVTCPGDKDFVATEFKRADAVWWGNRQVAHGPYMAFEVSEIPEPKGPEFGIVYFDLDKSAIRDSELGKLDALRKYLDENPKNKILIEGHCCDLATNAYNMKLGQRRADAVKAWLVQAGIDSARIYTVSFGEERLVAGSDNRPVNRRAEAVLRLVPEK